MSHASAAASRRIEPLALTWARRAVTVPCYCALAFLCFGLAPLWGLVALVVDASTGQVALFPRTRAIGFFALYLACEVVGVLVAALLWLTTAGGLLSGQQWYQEANAALQRGWTAALFKGALLVFSMRVETEGLELARTGPFLLFVRHSSTADAVLAAALVANPQRLLLRYVLKRELLWDPCLDIVGRRLPNAFIDRQAPRKKAEVEAIARLAHHLDARSVVLIYPEGTRFSPERRLRALGSLREKGLTALVAIAENFRAVLPPQLGGPLALIDAAPGVDLVLLEHSGFEGARTFTSFWSGELVGRMIRARVRRIPAASIPAADRDLWLFETWAETDRWISVSATPAGAST